MRSLRATLRRNKTHLLPVVRRAGLRTGQRERMHYTVSLCGFFIGELTARFIQVPDDRKRRFDLWIRPDICGHCGRMMMDGKKAP